MVIVKDGVQIVKAVYFILYLGCLNYTLSNSNRQMNYLNVIRLTTVNTA